MNDITRTLHEGQERLARDLRAVVNDAEHLLRHAVKDAGDGYGEARARLEQTLKSAKTELAGVEQAIVDGIGEAGRATDRYVRRNPWEAIGIGAGVGLLVGLLLGSQVMPLADSLARAGATALLVGRQRTAREHAAAAHARVISLCGGNGPIVDVQLRLLEDVTAARGILAAAKEAGADLLVAGSHGRTGLDNLLLGSVAAKLASLSPVPVLIVR